MSQPFGRFLPFPASLANGGFDLAGDSLSIMLSNSAPNTGWATYADAQASELPNSGGYHTGGFAAPQASSTETGGLYTLKLNPATLICSTPIGPFRWAILYDTDTNNGIVKPLIGYWDYGGELTLSDTDKFIVEWDATAGALTIQ